MKRIVLVSREMETDVMPRDVTEGAHVSLVEMSGDDAVDWARLGAAIDSIMASIRLDR